MIFLAWNVARMQEFIMSLTAKKSQKMWETKTLTVPPMMMTRVVNQKMYLKKNSRGKKRKI